MSKELELSRTHDVQDQARPNHQFRKEVPEAHRGTLDTRLRWLWNQRFGTVQTVYTSSTDILDRTAATLLIQAIMAKDLRSIRQIFTRLEGGAQFDDELNDDSEPMPL